VDIGKSSKRHLVAAVSRRHVERQSKEKKGKLSDQSKDGKCFEEHKRFRENLELHTTGLDVLGIQRCSSEMTVDSKPMSSGEYETIVHPRFSHFFVMLWYVGKIDHVIRNYTRCWLENNRFDNDLKTKSIQSICVEFSMQNELIESLFALFCHGYKHVMASISFNELNTIPGTST
jgi:hypothetical protein